MSGQAFVIVPPPGMKVILPNQCLSPSAINWPPGSTQNGDQPPQTMDHTKGFTGGTGTAGTKYKGYRISTLRGSPKAVGAIQILIGLVHLTFGSLLFMLSGLYMSNIMSSKYLYWGGTLFIFSGSFLVLAEHYPASCLWKGSLALNIISSLTAAAGTFVFLMDILYFPGDEYQEHEVNWKIAEGLSNTILFFAILEFFMGIIASRSIHDALHHQGDECFIMKMSTPDTQLELPVPLMTL